MTSKRSQDEPGPEASSEAGETRPRRRRRRRKSPSAAAPRTDNASARPEAPERRSRSRSRSSHSHSPSHSSSSSSSPPRRSPDELPETGFSVFDLPERVLHGVAAAGYLQPTEIQTRLIPPALDGKDIVARSRTGTGKTAAFVLPTLAQIEEVKDPTLAPEDARGPVRILVVVPTRELAIQVAAETQQLSHYLPARTACGYGGTPFRSQVGEIARSAVVVGTPGRLLDHVGRRTFDASTVEMVVLDEVDRMYDLGFRDDVDRILKACTNRRQTILVSATLNEDVEALVARHLGEHERILVESSSLTVDEVEQLFYVVQHDRKRDLLKAVLDEREPKRTIVFVRTKFTADRIAYDLKRNRYDAHEIHSGLPQRLREEILSRFRDGRLELLVATDVAARGLDIQGVDHVVNYDIPQNPEDYVHRVGRTARMGQKGWAITLVEPDDGPHLTAIEKLINREIVQQVHPGFELPPRKKPEEKRKEAQPTGLPSWCRPARRRR